MIVVVMGVAGAGKSTVGALLAEALGCPFLDADTLHPEGNVERMRRGLPLTDAHRGPWLAAIHQRMRDAVATGQSLVVACSTLKQAYRDVLSAGLDVRWVYLKGSEALIRSRLLQRDGHFMKADMLASQLDALEEPADAIVADIQQPPAVIVRQVLAALRQPAP